MTPSSQELRSPANSGRFKNNFVRVSIRELPIAQSWKKQYFFFVTVHFIH